MKNCGCCKALCTVKNMVKYFRDRNSYVYICSLDLAKAFAGIDHVAIAKKC